MSRRIAARTAMCERPIAEHANERHVDGPSPLDEAGALDEVGAGHQRCDKEDDFFGIHRTVGVEHHDDVACRGFEAGHESDALAATLLGDDAYAGIEPAARRRPLPSEEQPSTISNSWIQSGSRGSSHFRFSASLSVGMTRDTLGNGKLDGARTGEGVYMKLTLLYIDPSRAPNSTQQELRRHSLTDWTPRPRLGGFGPHPVA